MILPGMAPELQDGELFWQVEFGKAKQLFGGGKQDAARGS